MDSDTIVVNHNAGFFSCYTLRLHHILAYFNHNKKCPKKVDSTNQFEDYKINKHQDYTNEYISLRESLPIEYHHDIRISNENGEDQFSNYKKLNFQMITPFVEKYFSPSNTILEIVSSLENKYHIQYENLAVFYYRGTDKISETNICGYQSFIEKAKQIRHDNENATFLIVSDEINLITLFKETFSDVIICNELLENMGRSFIHSQYFLAMVLIMSKSNHIICSSGNVSLWAMLFRGHNRNIHQYLSPLYGTNNEVGWI